MFPILEYSLVYIPGTDSNWAKVGFFDLDTGISTVPLNLDNVFIGFLYEADVSDLRPLYKIIIFYN